MTHIKNKSLDGDCKKSSFTLQVVAVCSVLSVIPTLQSALVMSLIVIMVITFSSLFISLLRKHIPKSSRVICQMSIISCLVVVADQVLKGVAFDIAEDFSIFIGIIVVNCLVVSHARNFAMKNPPFQSFFDGMRYGVGYSVVLVFIGFVRELFGTGRLLGFEIFPLISNGGWYQTNTFFTLPASAMFILALFVGVVRTFDGSSIEDSEFTISPNTKNSRHRH